MKLNITWDKSQGLPHREDAELSTGTDAPAIQPDRQLDLSGLNCPLPILKTKAEMAKMQSGEVLHVITTDPLAPLDFKAFCARLQHELVHLLETAERCEFYIRKA